MKQFIAYFDFLGYKNFILSNSADHVKNRIQNLLCVTECSLSLGRMKEHDHGFMYADFSNSRINCLNISDTVIFWTNESNFKDYKELMDVCFKFNMRMNTLEIPTRGAIVFDEIDFIYGDQNSISNGAYRVNSIFGKGLVNAHLKAENLNFAGCVIDKSVINEIQKYKNVEETLLNYAIQYKTPYKDSQNENFEYVFRLVEGEYNETAYKNLQNMIIEVFTNDKKELNENTCSKLINTLRFLKSN